MAAAGEEADEDGSREEGQVDGERRCHAAPRFTIRHNGVNPGQWRSCNHQALRTFSHTVLFNDTSMGVLIRQTLQESVIICPDQRHVTKALHHTLAGIYLAHSRAVTTARRITTIMCVIAYWSPFSCCVDLTADCGTSRHTSSVCCLLSVPSVRHLLCFRYTNIPFHKTIDATGELPVSFEQCAQRRSERSSIQGAYPTLDPNPDVSLMLRRGH